MRHIVTNKNVQINYFYTNFKKMSENEFGKTIFSTDPNAETRKQDHIDLAFQSQVNGLSADPRFYYEPLLAAHPKDKYPATNLLGKVFRYPIWISSMTGGNKMAGQINENLARVCKDFGLGLGLGSCRQLLTDHTYLRDFDVRKYIGDQPLFTNLGIAQIEIMLMNNQVDKIDKLIDLLDADGLIVHINPLQEWSQPEGDILRQKPIDTIEKLLEKINHPIIVKEVGQGFGINSLSRLLQLPLAAIDFGAFGGTNFSKLELFRNPAKREIHEVMAYVGHTATEMVQMTNELILSLGDKLKCREIIVSGGVQNYLDGYYLTKKLSVPSIYGQASAFLRHAMGDYENLFQFVEAQTEGLKIANAYLNIKE